MHLSLYCSDSHRHNIWILQGYVDTVAIWLGHQWGYKTATHLCILCPRIRTPHVGEKAATVRQPGTNTINRYANSLVYTRLTWVPSEVFSNHALKFIAVWLTKCLLLHCISNFERRIIRTPTVVVSSAHVFGTLERSWIGGWALDTYLDYLGM